MDVLFEKSRLSGRIAAIPSKSDAHRLLICAALADAPTDIVLPALSEDIEATIACLTALGAEIRCKGAVFRVTPRSAAPQNPVLDAGESGSTLRFLLPVAGLFGQPVTFTGRGRLPDRPQTPLLSALSGHGMAFSGARLPFSASGRLTGGTYVLRGDISSQFVTGLLLALPKTAEGGRIELLPPVESQSYIDMTVRTLAAFGVTVIKEENAYRVPGGQTFRSPGRAEAEGDWSNAAFWLCAGAIGHPVTVTGLAPDSPQGDRAVVRILRRFGALVSDAGDGITVSPAPLRGITVDAADIPDLTLPLAMVAAHAAGETRFQRMGRLRLKECDRLAALEAMLNTLCGENRARVQGDTLTVAGGPVRGGEIAAQNDHRLVMSAALLALSAEKGVLVTGAAAVRKSYPGFVKDYQLLGGIAHELNRGQPA